MAYRIQLLNEILKIGNNELQTEHVIVDVNKMLLERDDGQKDVLMFPNPQMFHDDCTKIGVLTFERKFQHIFDSYLGAERKSAPKVTVIVFWSTYMWYGTYKCVPKSLLFFFKQYKDTNKDEPLYCTICMDTNDTMKLEFVFKCTHLFCTECIPKIKEIVCPLCRSMKNRQ
jgi:hypothetical protein